MNQEIAFRVIFGVAGIFVFLAALIGLLSGFDRCKRDKRSSEWPNREEL